MQDPEALAESLLKLEEIFPGQDISQLVVADTRLADPAVVAALPKVCSKPRSSEHCRCLRRAAGCPCAYTSMLRTLAALPHVREDV